MFKELHKQFEGDDIYNAEGQLGVLEGMIVSSFEDQKQQLTLKDLHVKTKDAKAKRILYMMNRLTVEEAISMTKHLANAIQVHRYKKTQDWKVKDMEIVLL